MKITEILFVVLICWFFNGHLTAPIDYESEINFIYLGPNSNSTENLVDPLGECDPNGDLAMIVHGWTEHCRVEWILDMARNLNEIRGGCIVCMDYYTYSRTPDYFALVRHFNPIADVLTDKLNDFERNGFDPNRIWMFGFSFGAQLAIEAGRRFSNDSRKISSIVACEPAGPGFDGTSAYIKLDPQLAAKNVQCIHTSGDKGTQKRGCHQNWMLGNCGRTQLAAGPPPKGSHGLCPYFYNSAFQNTFLAIPKPISCTSQRIPLTIPSSYHLGYSENRTSLLNGYDMFAETSKCYPFNKLYE